MNPRVRCITVITSERSPESFTAPLPEHVAAAHTPRLWPRPQAEGVPTRCGRVRLLSATPVRLARSQGSRMLSPQANFCSLTCSSFPKEPTFFIINPPSGTFVSTSDIIKLDDEAATQHPSPRGTYVFFFEIFILECCLFFYWYVCLSIDLEEVSAYEGNKC